MKSFHQSIIALTLFVLSSSCLSPTPVWGMHREISCDECHKFLSVNQDQPDHVVPSPLSITRVCLTCHDADQDQSGLNPPYVLNKTAPLPAGGSFSPTLFLNDVGHNVLNLDEKLSGNRHGEERPSDLGCLSCHDAHDNGNYRNLKREILGRRTFVQAVGDPNGRRNLYIAGMDEFCTACHQTTDPESGATVREGLPHHPVGVNINDAKQTDFQNRRKKTPKLSLVEYPDGNNNNRSDARVFCLSCHYAHASSFPHALRWDPVSQRGCLECHDETASRY